jgi:hypothetical protein
MGLSSVLGTIECASEGFKGKVESSVDVLNVSKRKGSIKERELIQNQKVVTSENALIVRRLVNSRRIVLI